MPTDVNEYAQTGMMKDKIAPARRRVLIEEEVDMADVVGVLLAAGAGTRMGRPKALLEHGDGTPWVVCAVRAMHDGGCGRVSVVIGAESSQVRTVLAPLARDHTHGLDVVEEPAWSEGIGRSLRTGLRAIADDAATAALIHLVDVPDVDARVVRRVLGHADRAGLARATYRDVAGHPVLLGRDHWAAVAESARGDAGARAYLAAHDVLPVDCSDLATGLDADTPQAAAHHA